jgi:hypothetical protein
MPTNRRYVVDRLEGTKAVLVNDRGDTVTVETRRLTPGAREGTVLEVPVDAQGAPLWEAAQVDAAETARRSGEAEERLKRLRKRDPGGDIKL